MRSANPDRQPRALLRRVATLSCVLAALAGPVLAGKAKGAAGKDRSAGDEPATLAQTVEGAEKLDGLLVFYRSPESLRMELPAGLEDRPLGFSAVLAHAAGDYVMRGSSLETKVVRWKRRGDHLVLVKQNLDFRDESGSTLGSALEAGFIDSPVFGEKLIPLRDEPAPLLIDASKLFGPGLAEILPERSGFSVRPEDAVLVSLKSFEDNVVARVAYTFRSKPDRGAGGGDDDGGGGGFARFLHPGRLPDARTAEVTVDYHFYRLPDDGYVPRYADERIGTWNRLYKDYSDADERDTLFRHLVVRWDVRKSDPQAAVSPVAEPVTFYLDRSVPEKWRSLVRDGALWWNTAFAKVGLEGAVRVLDPPDDAEWDPSDIHHSMIYWNLADDLVFSGAAGPSLVDPRSGKVLKANVYLNGEFFSYALNRYLVYAWWRAPEPGGGADLARARRETLRELAASPQACGRAASFSSQMAFARLVLLSRGQLEPGTAQADRFAREAFLELVAHEVGHALGMPHNWKASLVSRWEDVASGKVNGHAGSGFSASVMDYNPIYLAPRGTPQGDFFLQELGPYDDLAIEYVYRPLEQLAPRQRAAELARIAARAESEPGLIFDDGGLGDIDPTTNSDDFSSDPLSFAESRLRMIHEEVLPRLPELVLAEGHGYNLLRQALDSAIFSVAMDYIDMTARHVGGQILLRRRPSGAGADSEPAPPITPVAASEQRRALEILDRQVFAPGAFALSPQAMSLLQSDLLYDWNYPWRYESDYDLGGRIAGLYESALGTLLEPARLNRVLDNERRVAPGADRFTLPELFAHLERTAFSDLDAASLGVDRRALQRALVGRLSRLVLSPEHGTPAEASQVAAATLRSILRRLDAALPALETDAGYARAHVEDLSARAARTLQASIQLPAR